MKYYFIYKIVNLKNDKYYIGAHQTSFLDDGYMGSGKLLSAAIKKHGLENFRRDILEFFNSAEEMYNREAELVTESVVNDRNSYNLKPGGPGNFYYINAHGLNNSKENSKKHIERLKSDVEYKNAFVAKSQSNRKSSNKDQIPWNKGLSREDPRVNQYLSKREDRYKSGELTRSKYTSQKISDGLTAYWKNRGDDRSNPKVSAALKGRTLSDDHRSNLSNKMWITNGIENRFVHKDAPVPAEWYKGRILKQNKRD